jgi:L-asparagine transporter-like permease
MKISGPSVVLSFFLAALGTYTVFHLLAKMTAEDPQKGSFCHYAKKAYGNWAGFSCGWTYWFSNILIMGSQLTAISIFSQFWFPGIPLWLFSSGYALASIVVVLMGTSGFDRVENILAVAKVAAIVLFIVLAVIALLGWIPGEANREAVPDFTAQNLFPKGIQGFWSSLIYAFYAFGGIEVIGLMAMQLKKKEDAPKSGQVMLISLTIMYVVSLCLAVSMVPYQFVNEKESPFVTAMSSYRIPFFPHVFNGAMIIAGFSTMAASLFGVTSLLAALAEEGDAPELFAKKSKWKDLPVNSLALAAAGLVASILTAFVMPESIYEYITTAAGILLLFNWFAIIFSSFKILPFSFKDKLLAFTGILLILAAISGTLFEKTVRPGFYSSFVFVVVILLFSLIKKNRGSVATKKPG